MKDINSIMPKLPRNVRWGALMNKAPTSDSVKEMDKMWGKDKKWHTLFDGKGYRIVDGKKINYYEDNDHT